MALAVLVRATPVGTFDPSINLGLPPGTTVTLLRDGDAVDEICQALAPADLIVVDADVVVSAGWVEALANAASERTDIATVSASKVRGPRVVVSPVDSPVLLVTRRALNVAGIRAGERLSDFARRCTEMGFTHVLAGDVVVRASGEVPKVPSKAMERKVPTVSTAPAGPTGRASGGLVVGIDGELIDESLTGTFEVGLAISIALARRPEVTELHVIVQQDRVEAVERLLLDKGMDSISVTTLDRLVADRTAIDVAFRPYQDFLARTWPSISEYAHRNVMWTLDLIANVTPGYAMSLDDYARLNRTSARAWENADAIGVLTSHVGSMLRAYRGGEPDGRIFVLPAGYPEEEAVDPGGDFDDESLSGLDGAPFVLVLGSNYQHKGRAWFIRVMERVFDDGWHGALVLVGPSPRYGNSTELEMTELGSRDRTVVITGRVSGDDRARLLARATLTAAPSITEGWGMTPAESVAHGSTPIASVGGGLRDITPSDAVSLTMEDDAVDAATILRLLTDEDARRAQRSAWERVAKSFTWDRAAEVLVARMQETLASPRHFRSLAPDEDIARDPVRPLHWRLLDRILPEGGALRSTVARFVRRSA